MSVPQPLPPFAAAFGHSLAPLPPLQIRKRSASPPEDDDLTIKLENDNDASPVPAKKRRVTLSAHPPPSRPVSTIRRPPTTRPPSPSPQQPSSIATRNSFALRRAAHPGAGKKPADLLIRPTDQRPAIQSAPPIPDGGQGALYTDRLPIALPRLPSVMSSGDNVRRVAGNVPPTPTRLSIHSRQPPPPPPPPASASYVGLSARSPPASIPIATTLVPPTPSSLHHPGYSGDKAAFLAPFEMFYDALNDSKELKKWLAEQLQKSNSLLQSLAQQQDKWQDMVETLVDRKVTALQSDVSTLQRRVAELEDELRQAPSGSDASWADQSRTKSDSIRTGLWGHERDPRENQQATDAETGSPAAFGARTLSMNTTSSESSSFTRPGHHLPPPSVHGKASRAAVTGRSPQLAHLTSNERGTSSPHG
ncbi:hypothetical protein APHAL10511_002566 [Amanita phalloides]|nr:hypothetical protein APHAL10511_002566 [Amanita phalloides]